MLQSLQVVPYRAEQAITSGTRRFLFIKLTSRNSWRVGKRIPKKLATPRASSLETLRIDTATEP